MNPDWFVIFSIVVLCGVFFVLGCIDDWRAR